MNMEIFLCLFSKYKQGVSYTSKNGAICPLCGKKRMRTYSSPKWNEGLKIRYHKCQNQTCLLNKFQVSIKSIEKEEFN